ncbi:hypothetical protein SI65_02026 [Aspergillus cristatus]|uniref:Uncharacterized protein n=1 Tax=Aspergillus cristatus TaxID=573508 RepID=A0A1E3BTJ9_ASPCR|nr:hypothetical protein SI65_01855 [Aspergillus cristatus]ODM24436.1 hypothetical protein SI65_02026 [Aspergillus cristatus]
MLRAMSLKRKASFSTFPTPDMTPVVEGPSVTMDDAPHLNSRTRKRFRDDRPEEKIVYENTLRWLYSAQQRQESTTINTSTGDENENTDSEPLPTPETIDPRQQTLHRFFKSAPSSAPSSSHATRQSAGPIQTNNGFLQPYSHNMNSPGLSMGSDDNHSPSSRFMTADMDMDVDMDSGSDQSLGSKGGAGGFRWM